MRHLRTKTAPLAALLTLGLAGTAAAQQIDLPRPSPKAGVSQTVGVTAVEIHYSRPGVKGRKVWGELVPYGEVWRTGANENTTITFDTPVKIEGSELPAGTYGLQTIPTAGEWTVIFSKDADRWGAFFYKPENDALRIQVQPKPAEHQERLGFTFEDVTDTSAEVVLRWEKIAVPFTLEVDTPKLATAKIKSALRWQNPFQAATYCMQINSCLDEASRWLDASLAIEETFWNHRAKAQLLAKRNDPKGAVAHGEKALAAAKAAEQPPPANLITELEGWIAGWKKTG